MNANQVVMLRRLLDGIRFLADEADRNGLEHVARLLRTCACDARKTQEQSSELQFLSAVSNEERRDHK